MTDSPKSLGDDHLRAIGRVVTTWAIVDHMLQTMGYALTVGRPLDDVDENIAEIPFIGMQTRTLIGIIHSLLEYRHPEDKSKFKKLGERIIKAKTQRDTISHCLWQSGKTLGTVMPLARKTVGGLKGVMDQEFTAEEIEKHADLNVTLTLDLAALMIHWGYFPQPDALPKHHI